MESRSGITLPPVSCARDPETVFHSVFTLSLTATHCPADRARGDADAQQTLQLAGPVQVRGHHQGRQRERGGVPARGQACRHHPRAAATEQQGTHLQAETGVPPQGQALRAEPPLGLTNSN